MTATVVVSTRKDDDWLGVNFRVHDERGMPVAVVRRTNVETATR